MKPQNTDEINDPLSFGDSPDVEEFTIDEARYPSAAKAMREILDGYIAEGKTTKDFIMNVAGVFGPGIRPYLHRFINEWQEEQKIKKIETEVLKAIRMAEEPEAVRLLDTELERLEALLPQAEPNSPEWGQVVQAMTLACQQGCRMIAAAAKALKYPANPWEWDDSAPIDAVANLYPSLMGTDWHQRMLGQVMMAPSRHHPWYTLPDETCEMPPPIMKQESENSNCRRSLLIKIRDWLLKMFSNTKRWISSFCFICFRPMFQRQIRSIYFYITAVLIFYFEVSDCEWLLLLLMLFLPAIAWLLDLLAFLAPKKKKHKPKPVQLLQYEIDEIVRDVLEGPFDDEVYKKIKETFWDELERYGVISKGMESFRQVFIGELGDGIIPYLDRFEEDLSKIRFRHEPDDSAKSFVEKVKLFFLNTKYRTINRLSGYYFEGIKPFVAELFSMRIRPIYIQVFGIIWFFSKDDDKSKLIVLMLFFFPLIVTILEDIFDLNERKTS